MYEMSSVTVAWNWPLAVWCFLLGRWGRRMWGEYQWMQYVIGDPGHLKVFHTSDSAAVFVYVVKWSHHEIIDGPFFFFFSLAHTSHQQITAWTSGCSPISCLQMSVPSMPTSVTSTRMRLEFLISVLLSHINSLTRAPHVGALLYVLFE